MEKSIHNQFNREDINQRKSCFKWVLPGLPSAILFQKLSFSAITETGSNDDDENYDYDDDDSDDADEN